MMEQSKKRTADEGGVSSAAEDMALAGNADHNAADRARREPLFACAADWALHYATAMGWYVFPGKKDGKKGKVPLVKWGRGLTAFDPSQDLRGFAASKDPALIAAWWKKWPDAEIGIDTGRSGLIVLDVDVRDDKDGERELANLLAISGDLPPTLEQRTPSGGRQLVFTSDTLCRSLATKEGLDVRSRGGMIFVPSGKPDRTWTWRAPSPAPDWLPKEYALVAREKSVGSDDAGLWTVEDLEEALAQLNVEAFSGNHQLWLQAMCAAHQATNGEGEDVFIDWCMGDGRYADDEASIRYRWHSLNADKTGGTTYRFLMKLLREPAFWTLEHNPNWLPRQERPSAPEDDFDEVPMDDDALRVENPIERMNRSHFTVLYNGKFLVGREVKNLSTGHWSVEWSTSSDITQYLNTELVEVPSPTGSKLQSLGKYWLGHRERRQYQGVTFDPSPNFHDPDQYNLWRGWTYEPRKGDWSLLKRLIRDVLCAGDEASYSYVLRWCAFLFQHPERHAEVALVMRGGKGIGKGTLGRVLCEIAGQHGKQIANSQHLTGRFNSHLMDCIVLFVDEGYWAGRKGDEGPLKNLITEKTLTFEGKGLPLVQGPNRLHVIMASNEDWVVPASADERRYAIFDASEEAREALPPGFFTDLNRQLDEGGREAMLHELQNMDLKGWHPRQDVPQTKGLMNQKLESLKGDLLKFWWFRALETGAIPMVIEGKDWRESAIVLSSQDKDALLRDLNIEAKSQRHREYSKTKLAQFLAKAGTDVKTKDSKGYRTWTVPVLHDARKAFEAHMGGEVEWDDEGDPE
jgi:hypothetical protein